MSYKPNKSKTNQREAFVVEARAGETEPEAIARFALDPLALATSLLANLNKNLHAAVEVNAFMRELDTYAEAVANGDLARIERMMVAQAHSLDGLFYTLVNRSRANSNAGHIEAAETYMKLALRAQSQCRATAEAIAEIKNPTPMAFVKQANIAAGDQQVNNAPLYDASRAREIENQPNRLLETTNGERLDTRTKGAAGAVNSELVPVAEIDRAEDPGG